MKKILSLFSLVLNINSMNNLTGKFFIEEEERSIEKPKKKEEILSDSEKLNNVINYLNNLGHHTYTDHCPKIANSLKEIEALKVTTEDLKDTIEILKKNTFENSNWKCQII